jgi:hypothetical protein
MSAWVGLPADETTAVEQLAAELEGVGHRVWTAQSGVAAPDFVFTTHRITSGDALIRPAGDLPFAVLVENLDGSALRQAQAAQRVRTLAEQAARLGCCAVLVAPWPAGWVATQLTLWMALHAELVASKRAEAHVLALVADSRSINLAVGMLAERHHVSPDRAFDAVRRLARRTRQPAAQVAQAVLRGELDVAPTDADQRRGDLD